MRPITQEDETLFRTVAMAAKLGRADAVIEHLGRQYADQWDDPEKGFSYALAMVASLCAGGLFPKGARQRELGTIYGELMETLDDVLYVAPDHWLARYCRILVRMLLPTAGGFEEYFARGERASLIPDLADLMDRQLKTPWQPYFACTCVVAAGLAYTDEPHTPRAAQLIVEAAGKPNRPIPFQTLGSVMCQSFVELHSDPNVPERALLGTMMSALFPNQPAAVTALHEQPAR